MQITSSSCTTQAEDMSAELSNGSRNGNGLSFRYGFDATEFPLSIHSANDEDICEDYLNTTDVTDTNKMADEYAVFVESSLETYASGTPQFGLTSNQWSGALAPSLSVFSCDGNAISGVSCSDSEDTQSCHQHATGAEFDCRGELTFIVP